jgi:hypothetical protein
MTNHFVRPKRASSPDRVAELDTAIRVAQRMLCHYGTVDNSSAYAYTVAHGGLAEALRLLLRALGAEAVDAR